MKNFEFVLFGTLFIVRTILPREENWTLRSSLDLILHDVMYMVDSLDFSKILFDNSRKSMDKTLKLMVLFTMAFTSCIYCVNTVYRPAKMHIKYLYDKRLTKLEQIEHQLWYDPFIRFLVPNLFFEIPIIIFRTYIFYGYKTISWSNLTFLIKNIVSIFLTFVAYLEVKQLKIDGIFYSNGVL